MNEAVYVYAQRYDCLLLKDDYVISDQSNCPKDDLGMHPQI